MVTYYKIVQLKCMFKLVHIANLLTIADSTVAALYYPILDFLSILMYCNTH